MLSEHQARLVSVVHRPWTFGFPKLGPWSSCRFRARAFVQVLLTRRAAVESCPKQPLRALRATRGGLGDPAPTASPWELQRRGLSFRSICEIQSSAAGRSIP